MSADLIYLDNNASTQPLPEVVEAMLPFLGNQFANPSSTHQFGQAVRYAVEVARGQVAGAIGASAKEIVFTAGGTESINLAIRGALAARPTKRRVITSGVEHSAVTRIGEQLAREGYDLQVIGVDQAGQLDMDALAEKLTDETAMVSLIWANNETGVILDVECIASITAARGIPLHLDAVQAVGKLPIDVANLPVQLLSLSGHKFHGPKGVGALYVKRRTRLRPLIVGGRQERDLRGGTENVAGIVGMGVAAESAKELPDGDKAIAGLRDRLEAGVTEAFPGARVIGKDAPRINNTANISFPGLEAEAILLVLSENGICASAGSACSSGSLEPSPVLQAMGLDQRISHGAVRFSLSHINTKDEIDYVVRALPQLLARLSALAAG